MDKRSFMNWITKRSSIWTLSLCLTGAIVLGGIAAVNNTRDAEDELTQVESELGEYAYLEEDENGESLAGEMDQDEDTAEVSGSAEEDSARLGEDSSLTEDGESVSVTADGTQQEGEAASANANGTVSEDEVVSASADGTAQAVDSSVSDEDTVSEAASANVISEQALLDAGVAFSEEDALMWPSAGTILIDYSMDSSVYFATLNQYKYNPALIIGSDVGNQVIASAKGIVESIDIDEVTGNTLVLNIGNGYKLTYGQLKELAVEEGDVVEEGALLGYVSEPTKYYSVEGSNLYFAMTQNEEAVDPVLYLD